MEVAGIDEPTPVSRSTGEFSKEDRRGYQIATVENAGYLCSTRPHDSSLGRHDRSRGRCLCCVLGEFERPGVTVGCRDRYLRLHARQSRRRLSSAEEQPSNGGVSSRSWTVAAAEVSGIRAK